MLHDLRLGSQQFSALLNRFRADVPDVPWPGLFLTLIIVTCYDIGALSREP
jgi:hypothetical protein